MQAVPRERIAAIVTRASAGLVASGLQHGTFAVAKKMELRFQPILFLRLFEDKQRLPLVLSTARKGEKCVTQRFEAVPPGHGDKQIRIFRYRALHHFISLEKKIVDLTIV